MRTSTLLLAALITVPAFSAPPSALEELEGAYRLCQQGRDSGNAGFYLQADQAIDRALAIAPDNREAPKLRVLVMLGRHDFTKALVRAEELNHKTPDDVMIWGYLADANIGLGNYEEAIKDAQWILDLRPGSTLGFTKAAELREIHGDLEGANQFYENALLRISPSDAAERAWLMTRIGRIQMNSGNAKVAHEYLEGALKLSPSSQFAMLTVAYLYASEGNYAQAISLCQQRVKLFPSAGNLYDLAVMHEKAGNSPEAETAYYEFEAKARAEVSSTLNHNRELVLYYADHKKSPAEALSIASKDAETRHDIPTLDAYAWALYRKGNYPAAKTQMDRALATGIREGTFFCHALQISQALHDDAATKLYEKELSKLPSQQYSR